MRLVCKLSVPHPRKLRSFLKHSELLAGVQRAERAVYAADGWFLAFYTSFRANRLPSSDFAEGC
jgi:hypothetical protein